MPDSMMDIPCSCVGLPLIENGVQVLNPAPGPMFSTVSGAGFSYPCTAASASADDYGLEAQFRYLISP
jgi:hypothetical protein